MVVKQGRFYLRHNTLSEDIPIAIIFKVTQLFGKKKRGKMLSCSSRMKIGSSSRVSMYRGTWQGLETANFFPLGSLLYCIAKRRLSSVFFCKESISGPGQIPATPLLCPVRCLCCYRSEGFWFVRSYVKSCVEGHCCCFFICGIECMDCSRIGGVW